MTRQNQLHFALALLLGLAGCDSGPTGHLLEGTGDDDDAAGDDDDSVGDDDDSVGDDDDSVGDDDDSVGDDDDDDNPWAGWWEGESSLSRFTGGGGEQPICDGQAGFEITGQGDVEGFGDCALPENAEATFEFVGWMSPQGELMDGGVVMTTPNTGTTDWLLEGGIYEEEGEVYIYVWWEPQFGGGGGGGGGGFYGDAWGVR